MYLNLATRSIPELKHSQQQQLVISKTVLNIGFAMAVSYTPTNTKR
jgi:hypothetical protein